MDRNSIIGIILIVAVLVVYGIYTKPSKEDVARLQHQRDSIALAEQTRAIHNVSTDSLKAKNDSTSQLPDSVKLKKAKAVYGVFGSSAVDTNKFYTIENSLLKLTISSKGGRPYAVELKKYNRFDKSPVILFNGDSTRFGLNFFSQNRTISTNDLFFRPVKNITDLKVSDRADSLSFRLYAGDSAYIEYIYTVLPNEYMVGFHVNFVNMNKIIPSTSNVLDLNWEAYIRGQEKGAKNENTYTNIHYKFYQGEDESFGPGKAEETKDIPNRLNWIAFKQQFFSTVLIADKSFYNANLQSKKMEEGDKYLKHYTATIGINFENKPEVSVPMHFYFGPNHYKTLLKYDLGLENLVTIGSNIIKWINKYVIINIFNWLGGFLSNYGIIILILTLIIKIALFPLTYKSYQSQAKMRVLKPQIDEINSKIPKDKAMERQQATMALYKKAGVNPLGGCLPMLLQLPILFAMFRFFPTSIELRHQGFLWATDLSTYDSILNLPFSIPFYGDHVSLFTILMTATTLITTWMSQSTTDTSSMPGMKTMMYIMPVMFMFMFNSFSSGLTYYYFLANLITIGQNEIFKRMIDEKKLLAKIHANKAKPVKKSAFADRLEKMAKERGYKLPKK